MLAVKDVCDKWADNHEDGACLGICVACAMRYLCLDQSSPWP